MGRTTKRVRVEGTVIRSGNNLVHCIAECMVCGKTFQDYNTARDKARAHAQRTGHRVTGEAGYVFEYGG